MRSAARLMGLALCLALVASSHHHTAAAIEQGKLVAPGRLVVAGRKLSCGATATLLRDFEGFAVSSTVIMLNMQALQDLPRPVQWLIYYHECGHILFGPSETAADCYAILDDRGVKMDITVQQMVMSAGGGKLSARGGS